MAGSVLLFVAVLLSLFGSSLAFYLPGVAPRDYSDGERVSVKVIKLDSVKTQLPYDYYSLPFCRPKMIEESAENLGEVLSGDRIENSLYDVFIKQPTKCTVVCPKREYSDGELKQFAEKIEDEYRVNWILDNMPAATKYYTAPLVGEETAAKGEQFVAHYEKGFALGFVGQAEVAAALPSLSDSTALPLVLFSFPFLCV